MTFPAPVPEIPAANVDKAAAYYVNTLGFNFDWGRPRRHCRHLERELQTDAVIGFLPNLNDGYPRPWPKTSIRSAS